MYDSQNHNTRYGLLPSDGLVNKRKMLTLLALQFFFLFQSPPAILSFHWKESDVTKD